MECLIIYIYIFSLLQKTVWMYPFQIHSIALSTFASLIGPFGGFFASGFKRAFKIKVIIITFKDSSCANFCGEYVHPSLPKMLFPNNPFP